ncbi:conserved repeat domain protein [Clostridium sp. CAG:245]|nr:conserved repeat domain protein [Clostridium sp. CAG:245]
MKKFKKLVSSILITMLTVATLGSISAVKAASAGPLYLGIVSLRRAGYGYQQEGSKVWKIAEYDSENGKTADLSKTIYCIKGGPGFGSSDMATGGVPTISKYTQKFNLKDLASIPSTYSKILPTGSNYNSLMWLLDNIYIMPAIGTDNTTAREEFLKSKIPNELYELITDDDIDAVQQLAIWYFTNPSGDKYHYETSNFKINSIANVDSNYASMGDIFGDDGWDREDAIEALFQYYITNAKANSNYKSTNNTTSPIEIVKSNATMTKVGSNYVAGPYKINQLLNVDYTLNATFTDINGTTITPSIGIKDVSGNVTATTKTLKELVGQEFYLIMPTSSNISGIKMTVNTSYTSKTVDYWSVADAPTTEQPVVIVNETPLNFSDATSIVVPKPFDLSLRKFITNINGTEITNRIPQVDVSKLASGEATTATYNHTKTPLKVAIGDVVTYTIRVYNEGDIDGYVEEITDHLPDQLEFIVDDQVNIEYGWKIASSTDLKTIKTEYLSKANETTDGANKISAFNGTTLAYKDVKIKCRVVATDPMADKITNIADITKFTDGDGNTVTDRDSQENNVNLPTGKDLENYRDSEINRGEEYIPGQQDDDDFEKLTLKEFDLSLRKFITGVNGTAITNREPQVNVTPLKNGGTTAIYNHPKTPVSVAIGDLVEYTIRVYNEAEIDGYVEEITDHLPDQLEFVAGNEINTKYGWVVDSTNSKIIKTNYLSKAKEASEGANKIKAFDGTKLDYKDVKVVCKVVSTDPMPTKITNIADITKFTDGNGNTVTDRDSQENNVNLPTGKDLENYRDSEINRGEEYIPGQQDDDDFEKLTLKEFDLSLRKFITGVNGTKLNDEEITSRIPQPDVSKLADGTATTATYNHPKTPISVAIGDVVEYTIRVYNEAEVDGYVEEITDHLPDQLEFVAGNETNTKYGWTVDSNNSKIIKTKYLSKANETTEGDNKIKAFDGTKLDYKDVKVVCKVVSTDPMPTKITNIADITKFTDGNGNTVTDRDSQENNVNIPSDLPGYKDDEIGKDYVPGQQDDDDFEKLKIKEFDLALRKFITKVNNTEIKSRIPQVDTTPLKNGTGTTAIYNHSKEPVKVSLGAVVEYTIRVYNEGQVDGYVEEIKDHLPDQLEFIKDNETNKKYGWTVDSTDSKVIKTSYLCKANEKVAGENKIPAFDGTTLSYKEVKVACKVVSTDPMPSKITNLADISDFTDGEGNKVTDRDSKEDNVKIPEDRPGYKDDESKKDYVPGQEDDDDFEKVTLVKFDLSLRKFITAVNNTEITSRIPQVDVTPIKDGSSTTAKYDHPKDPVLVSNGNIVTYTIRVFNEGEMDGYASEIKDDMPQGLKFLTDNKTNIEYRWKMLDKDGKETENLDEAVSIVTDYLSKEQEKTAGANLLKAFDGEKLDYRDVKVAFEVTEPNTSDRILINQAQISKDSDKDGNDVTDQDSVPDKWNEGEDDQDIEKVKVQYFDLSLRKWVTQAIVTENGEEKIIESGHKAEDDPEDVVKVDLKKSKINKVTIKFRYKIRVKNEGNIAGYAKELKDYIPNGLKFVPEDNPLWKQIDEKTITTDQTKDILLQPGDTTEVEVVLTWINDSENFGVMDNWAEISKDHNDFNSPDIDSTPDNNKKGEDDIDDAPVSVGVQTGQIKTFTTIGLAVLVILSSGVVLIKKFVL